MTSTPAAGKRRGVTCDGPGRELRPMLTGPPTGQPDGDPGTRRACEKRWVTLTPVTWVRPATLPRPPRRLRGLTTRGTGPDSAAATYSQGTLPNLCCQREGSGPTFSCRPLRVRRRPDCSLPSHGCSLSSRLSWSGVVMTQTRCRPRRSATAHSPAPGPAPPAAAVSSHWVR